MSYDPQVVAYFDNLITNTKCAFAALTLLSFEYVFNIHREVDLFWKRKLSGASVLFFFARYTPLLAYIIADVEFAPMSDTSCSVLVYSSLVLSGFQYVPWAVGANYSKFRGVQPFNDDTTGCGYLIYGFPPELVHKCRVLTCMNTNGLGDFLVAIVTWWSTYKTSKLTRGLKGFEQNALSRVMLRDGSIYFVVLVVLNLLHLIFTSMNVATSRSFSSFLPLFTEPLTGVLVVRFLLNLQAANRRTAYSQSSPSQIMGGQTLQFAGVLESLSGPLAIGDEHTEAERQRESPLPGQGGQATIQEVKLDAERGGRNSDLSDISV